jgi:hypothetical protein
MHRGAHCRFFVDIILEPVATFEVGGMPTHIIARSGLQADK